MGIFNIILRNYHDFQDGRGKVKARRHKNGGGWVADTAFVSSSDTYIDKDAKVSDFAIIDGKSKIIGKVDISGKAYINSSTIRNNVCSKHSPLTIKDNVTISKSEINVNQLYFDSAVSTANITDKVYIGNSKINIITRPYSRGLISNDVKIRDVTTDIPTSLIGNYEINDPIYWVTLPKNVIVTSLRHKNKILIDDNNFSFIDAATAINNIKNHRDSLYLSNK